VPTGFTETTTGTWGGTVTFTANPSFSFAPGAKPITFTIVAFVSSTVASNTSVKNTVALSSLGSGTPLVAPGGHMPSASVTAQVNVAAASLGASSLGNGKEDLTIYGTSGSNFIYVLPTTGNKILVIENGHTLAPVLASSITGRIVVYACGSGTNVVYISPLLAQSAWIDGDGGTGNDIFYADSGNCVLVGGSGRNELISGRGDNILIGGSGAGPNIILGTQGNNVEISGSTSYDDDAHDVAMAAILAEWSSTDSYTKRVQCLDGASTSGQNGVNAFTSATITRGTGLGYLFGGVGENTYFALQTGPVRARDYIFGHKSLEVITTI
jgi:Ca2+-binding RTX toxin-like protein